MAEIPGYPGKHRHLITPSRFSAFERRHSSLEGSTNSETVINRDAIGVGIAMWHVPEVAILTIEQRRWGSSRYSLPEIRLGVYVPSFEDLRTAVRRVQGTYDATVDKLAGLAILPQVSLIVTEQKPAILERNWLAGLRGDTAVEDAHFIIYGRTEEEIRTLKGELQHPPYLFLDISHQDEDSEEA